MTNNAAEAARSSDRISADHLPACPRCGDLLEAGTESCGCGIYRSYLYETGVRRRAAALPKSELRAWWTQNFTADEIRQLAGGME